MYASFLAELAKVARRPAILIVCAVWLTLILIFGYVFPALDFAGTPAGPGAAAGRSERVLAEALPAQLVPSAIQGFPMFAGALALLIGVLATGAEYGWETVKVLHTQRPGRAAVIAGQLLGLAVVMLVIVLATFAVSAGASLVVASVTDRPVAYPGLSRVVLGIGAGWLIVGMWCLAGAFLGTLLRSTALGVGIGIAWALALENLLRIFAPIVEVLEVLVRYTPGTNAGGLAAALGVPTAEDPGGTPGVTNVVGGTPALLVLLGYVVLFASATVLLVRHRDIAGA